MTDPLGQSQVLPYLVGLAAKGYDIHLISFEKQEERAKREEHIRGIVEKAGIHWHPQKYTKSPPVLSTIWDISRMKKVALRLHRQYDFHLVHCRSYISSLVGLHLKKKGLKFIFDMRGFWVDERVEGNIWDIKNPLFRQIYRFYKKKEKQFIEKADQVISLTKSAESEIPKLEIQKWATDTHNDHLLLC